MSAAGFGEKDEFIRKKHDRVHWVEVIVLYFVCKSDYTNACIIFLKINRTIYPLCIDKVILYKLLFKRWQSMILLTNQEPLKRELRN